MKERQVFRMSASYNVGAKYEIIGRVLKGTSVMAYRIKDRTDNSTSIVEKSIVEQLTLNRQIYNCNAQIYNDIVNMKGVNCKLNKLPKFTMNGEPVPEVEKPKKKAPADLKLIGKVQNGRKISDYIVVALNDTSKKMKVPKDTVIQLAQDGRILNAKIQMNNGVPMLRGAYGVNLAQLTTYN